MFKYDGKYFTLVCGFTDFWSYYFKTDFPFFMEEHKSYILKLAQYEVNDELEEYLMFLILLLLTKMIIFISCIVIIMLKN